MKKVHISKMIIGEFYFDTPNENKISFKFLGIDYDEDAAVFENNEGNNAYFPSPDGKLRFSGTDDNWYKQN